MSQVSPKKSKIGPILTLATLAFFLAAGVYYVIAQTRETKRMEQTLIERYGWANEYIPAIDGSISPQRMEKFLHVRKMVQPGCLDYQAILDDLIDLETIETNQDLSSTEKVTQGIRGAINVFSSPSKFLKFLEVRNRTLLAEEMGLGEYIYIYVAVYGEQLAQASDSVYSGMEDAYISPRARNEFVMILKNQLAVLDAAGPEASNARLTTELREEIEALKNGSHTSPWPNGPTGRTRESLAPYHEQLVELYCSGIVKIELQQKNRGLEFEG
jgi:hypothetical protein